MVSGLTFITLRATIWWYCIFRKQCLTFHANCLLKESLHEISNKRQKECLWKQRTHYRLENGASFLEQIRKILQNVVCWFFLWLCNSSIGWRHPILLATDMCNYYFCKHLMKYCRGEITASLRELNCIPDKLSVSSQSDDRNPHTACCTPILGSG